MIRYLDTTLRRSFAVLMGTCGLAAAFLTKLLLFDIPAEGGPSLLYVYVLIFVGGIAVAVRKLGSIHRKRNLIAGDRVRLGELGQLLKESTARPPVVPAGSASPTARSTIYVVSAVLFVIGSALTLIGYGRAGLPLLLVTIGYLVFHLSIQRSAELGEEAEKMALLWRDDLLTAEGGGPATDDALLSTADGKLLDKAHR